VEFALFQSKVGKENNGDRGCWTVLAYGTVQPYGSSVNYRAPRQYVKIDFGLFLYPVVLHPYIPFIIGDTEGHDRLCGHYTARFEKVKQLCLACECPPHLSGYSKAKFNHRKPAAINRLIYGAHSVESKIGVTTNLNALKNMSQNYLRNGFGLARFGSHNDREMFGACPGEMLHLVSLGWFKYCLEAFASQAGGKNLVAVKRYDSLCATRIGTQLSRHSDRDLP
jgi:hypothetical protein